ncbi:hypothetical protein [Methylobacterium sp. Leaf466]|uniref:hypothetical protein n=1 Tax=Methylobacterium sp. Leaf466 TaxID=1736386 RepID=UPI000B0674C8|nr:hypothetical protein [Methylobacterium sp. Leaf466]
MSTPARARPSLLDAATDQVATGRPAPEKPPKQSSEIVEEVVLSKPQTVSSKRIRPPRKRVAADDPRGITVWVEPDVFRALKQIGLAEALSMREMMTDAIAGYLRRKKQLSIAKSPPPKS